MSDKNEVTNTGESPGLSEGRAVRPVPYQQA